MSRLLPILLLLCAFYSHATVGLASEAHAHGTPDAITQANAELQVGEVDKTLALLSTLPPAEAYLMHCRVELMLEHWDEAASECEQSVKLDPQSSVAHMWFGRALGERASRASFISAYSLGKRVHAEFEEAVRLDPHSADALTDLAEFDYDAPGIVGGGIDKALKIATQLDKLDHGRTMELYARIDAQRKDYDTAEREFKQAISIANHPAYQWVSLAGFYRSRERWSEMIDAIRSALTAYEHDRKSAPALYDAASILIRTKREPELAVKLLREYLASPVKSEQAPSFAAHARLARLLDQLGDKASARSEDEAALALAHDYKPAQEHKH